MERQATHLSAAERVDAGIIPNEVAQSNDIIFPRHRPPLVPSVNRPHNHTGPVPYPRIATDKPKRRPSPPRLLPLPDHITWFISVLVVKL